MFPINTLFGGAAYDKPLTIVAANTLISDGQNLWAGTYTIVPPSTTNPIVSLYPNTYLLTIEGVVKPARFVVPPSDGTNVLDVTTLLTSGPLFYFGTNGFANLLPGENIVFVTNSDGSITIDSTGVTASYATNASFATLAGGVTGQLSITNLPPQALTNGENGVTLSGAFFGDGTGLLLPHQYLTNGATGVLLNGTFSGDGSGLTNIRPLLGTPIGGSNGAPASLMLGIDGAGNLTTNAVPAGGIIGQISVTNLPPEALTNSESGVTLAGTFTGDGTGLLLPPQYLTNGVIGAFLNGTFSGAFVGNGSGLTNLPFLAGENIVFVTNSDGSITIGNTGAIASYATNANFATLAGSVTGQISVANLPPQALTNSESGVTLSGTFTGDGTGLLLPHQYVTNGATGVLLNGTFSGASIGDGSGLTNSRSWLGASTGGSNGAPASMMLGVDGAGRLTTNAIPTGGSGGGGNVNSNTVTAFSSIVLTNNLITAGDSTIFSKYTPSLGNYIAGGAGDSVITGDHNVLIGPGAGGNLTSGEFNVDIGPGAGYLNSGSANVLIGYQPAFYANSDSSCIGIGVTVFGNGVNANNSYCTAIGNSAMSEATNSQFCVAVGQSSQQNGIDGYENTSVGVHSMVQNIHGNYNSCLGLNALIGSTNSFNTAVGVNTFNQTVTGPGYNTALGYQSGWQLKNGDHNIFVQVNGIGPTNTSNSTIIGGDGSLNQDNSSGEVNINNLIIGHGGTTGGTMPTAGSVNFMGFISTGTLTNGGPTWIANIMRTNFTIIDWGSNGPALTGQPHEYHSYFDVNTNRIDKLIW